MPELIRQQREQLPGVRFELTQGAAGSIATGVQLQLDVGIVSPRPTIPGLVRRRLLRQRLRLAVPTTGLGIAVLPVEEVPVLPAGVRLVNIADADAVREIGMVWQPHPTGQISNFIDRARAATASRGQ